MRAYPHPHCDVPAYAPAAPPQMAFLALSGTAARVERYAGLTLLVIELGAWAVGLAGLSKLNYYCHDQARAVARDGSAAACCSIGVYISVGSHQQHVCSRPTYLGPSR